MIPTPTQHASPPNRTRLGSVLLDMGLINAAELGELLVEQRAEGGRLGELLVARNRLSPEQLARALATRLGVAYLDLATPPDPLHASRLDDATVRRYLALPVGRDAEGVLVVAMADPQDLLAVDDLRMLLGEPIRPALAMPEAIMSHVGLGDGVEELAADLAEAARHDPAPHSATDIAIGENDGPVIRFVNSVIVRAVTDRASDIHIEPHDGELAIRFRIDGVLRPATSVPLDRGPAIVSRLKVMSDLDITERRVPQDGRVGMRIGDRQIDLRIATLPTVSGESVVVRLLDRSTVAPDLAELGFSPESLARFEASYRQPHGLVLVTGPTGSGKTTTMYAALSRLNDSRRKIITVEDPVEYRLPGVNQVQVHPKAGLTFASGLRSMLRCDPDVIMVGEIRDVETARIAVDAALTGHLVLATIHTNDAPSALVRITEMGVEPFLVASALRGVMSQRLARQLCRECREAAPVARTALSGLTTFESLDWDADAPLPSYRARGCARCSGSGYRGRFAIGEMLVVDDTIERLVVDRAAATDIRIAARQAGMRPMADEGVTAMVAGRTSIEELTRIIR